MKRFVEGTDRAQSTLFPEYLEDWIDENNPVRVIDVFVDELDLGELGFDGIAPEATGRPSYHPSVLLKLYIYGYLHRVQSSRRLEREAGRNVEVMWLTGRLVPDHKTIADFRKDNGEAIRRVGPRSRSLQSDIPDRAWQTPIEATLFSGAFLFSSAARSGPLSSTAGRRRRGHFTKRAAQR
jgi:transposase